MRQGFLVAALEFRRHRAGKPGERGRQRGGQEAGHEVDVAPGVADHLLAMTGELQGGDGGEADQERRQHRRNGEPEPGFSMGEALVRGLRSPADPEDRGGTRREGGGIRLQHTQTPNGTKTGAAEVPGRPPNRASIWHFHKHFVQRFAPWK